MDTVIVSSDPGTANFGYSALKFRGEKFRVLEIGQIFSEMRNLTGQERKVKPTAADFANARRLGSPLDKTQKLVQPAFQESLTSFYAKASDLLEDYQPQEVVVERFQSRGLRGATIEAISMMIACISLKTVAMDSQITLLVAVQWKRHVSDTFRHMDEIYPLTKVMGYTPHETDAVFMALYLANKKNILSSEISYPLAVKKMATYARKNSESSD